MHTGREIDSCAMLWMYECEYENACGMYASVDVRLGREGGRIGERLCGDSRLTKEL